VELDDLFDGAGVHHREMQSYESQLFQSYFKHIAYMEGGLGSGFRHVKPEDYSPRLFQVHRTKKTVKVHPVAVKASSLNHGDVFVLDAGLVVYTFVGKQANAFDKMKGGAVAHNIVAGRNGKAKKVDIVDDAFWKILGGSEKDVQPASDKDEDAEPDLDPTKTQLVRLDDATGHLTFKKIADKNVTKDMLESNDVFIVDTNIAVFVWIGNGSSKMEKSGAMKMADEYLAQHGKPKTTPITTLKEGQINFAFEGAFKV